MAGSDNDFHMGHRERLRQKFLDGKLADYELLEMLLGYAIPRRDVRPLARALMAHFGGVHQILAAPLDKLVAFRGVGRNTAIFLKSINQIMATGYCEKLTEQPIFRDATAVANYCRTILSGKTTEEMHVFYLGSELCMLADDVHSCGTNDEAVVYPREILKRALVLNARSVVLVHNHPTPNKSFSTADIEITTTVKNLLAAAGIELFDHFVVSGTIVYSARNMFLLK